MLRAQCSWTLPQWRTDFCHTKQHWNSDLMSVSGHSQWNLHSDNMSHNYLSLTCLFPDARHCYLSIINASQAMLRAPFSSSSLVKELSTFWWSEYLTESKNILVHLRSWWVVFNAIWGWIGWKSTFSAYKYRYCLHAWYWRKFFSVLSKSLKFIVWNSCLVSMCKMKWENFSASSLDWKDASRWPLVLT